MNTLDNLCLHQLYEELDNLIDERKHVRQYHQAPDGYTEEEYLQELDEEEQYLRMKIEELSIVQSDYFDEEF
jgi:hypothetical protein